MCPRGLQGIFCLTVEYDYICMNKLLVKKSIYAGSYFLLALFVEFISFNVIGIAAFPTYFWLDIAILFLIAAVIFIIPSFTAQAIVIIFLLVLQSLIAVANEALYTMSGFVFNLSMLNLLYELGGVFDNSFINLPFLVFLVFLVLAESALLFSLRKIRAGNQFRLQTVVILLFVFCTASLLSVAGYFLQASAFSQASQEDELFIYKDDESLYDSQFLSAKAYRKFGTFAFYIKNIENFITDEPVVSEEDREQSYKTLDEYFSEGKMSSSLDDLDLTPYDAAGKIRTGMMNGQNVVLIVIESGEWYAINRKYTPTLYSLADQGISMVRYFARDKTNHSEAISILGSYPAELTNSIAPSLSNPDGLVDHNFAFTLPNILQNDNYTTNYFHANSGEFYWRGDTFGDLYGFDHQTFKDEMDRIDRYDEPADVYHLLRDSDVISNYLPEFTRTDEGDEAFFTMMMTITGHGDYDELLDNGDYTSDMSAKQKQEFSENCLLHDMETYYEKIDSFPAVEDCIQGTMNSFPEQYDSQGDKTDIYLRYKRYQATIMDLDVGLNRLLHSLEESGELDNTMFVFYADHSAYYFEQNYEMKGYESGTQWQTELYNIPFFIWSGNCMDLNVETDLYEGESYNDGPYYYSLQHNATSENIGGIKITKFCNSFDILLTILDLLGYEYNCNLYQGVSVFDAAQSVFISRESGMFNEYIYTDGDKIYLKAKQEGDSVISLDGEIIYTENKVSICTEYGLKTWNQKELRDLIYVESGFIVYDLDAVLTDDKDTGTDYRNVLSAGTKNFLEATIAYYEKQEMLEQMYASDYFSYAEIETLVSKIF